MPALIWATAPQHRGAGSICRPGQRLAWVSIAPALSSLAFLPLTSVSLWSACSIGLAAGGHLYSILLPDLFPALLLVDGLERLLLLNLEGRPQGGDLCLHGLALTLKVALLTLKLLL